MPVMFGILIAVGYLGSPIILIWVWARWASQVRLRTVPSILSLTGFTLATASALLAVSSIAYALVIQGFRYYDPLLLRIFRWGILLSLGGIVFGLIETFSGVLISTAYKDAVGMGLLIVILLFAPSGIFVRAGRRV